MARRSFSSSTRVLKSVRSCAMHSTTSSPNSSGAQTAERWTVRSCLDGAAKRDDLDELGGAVQSDGVEEALLDDRPLAE